MRLRKNMKRTAAAVLALSMAVSAVAAPASAAYICDVSQGSVEVSVDTEGNKSITVGGAKVENDGDGSEDIIITGDNTKPAATESLNAAEENADENTSEVEKPTEAEKSGETKTEGEGKTQNSAAEGEDEGDEPTSQELLTPEDEEKKDEQKPAETQQTEQTQKPTDKVLLYDQYDPEANKEATKQETKEKSYEDNAPTTLSESVQAAANNVVKIINNSASVLKVILRDLKVDAGDTAQAAMTISGSGNVTLELDGKNKLQSGTSYAGLSKNNGNNGNDGTLTIQDKNGTSGSLESHGGEIGRASYRERV